MIEVLQRIAQGAFWGFLAVVCVGLLTLGVWVVSIIFRTLWRRHE